MDEGYIPLPEELEQYIEELELVSVNGSPQGFIYTFKVDTGYDIVPPDGWPKERYYQFNSATGVWRSIMLKPVERKLDS
jgi:hypothetical protein